MFSPLPLVLPADSRPLVEQQTALGKTLLPQTLTSLLKGALNDRDGPGCKSAIFELLRVAANLCRDHGRPPPLSATRFIAHRLRIPQMITEAAC